MTSFDDEEYESFDLDEDDAVADDTETDTDESGSETESESDSDDLEDDDLDDATDEEIDFVIATYREDGQPVVQPLAKDLANELEELVVQLRRVPGDAGALGFVSLVEEVFVIVRVRGRNVQVLLSDGTAANEWPLARDVADFLGVDIPDPDDEPEAMGDLGILADLGVSEFDLEAMIDNLDVSSDQMLTELADKIKIGPQFRKVAEAAFAS